MGNRKLPFGYKMVLGEIVTHAEEAMLVREIFHRYTLGESLKDLAEAMQNRSIPYDKGRVWNKNMVARILEDQRYTGEKGYPKIIEPEELLAVAEKRSQKCKPSQKNEAQKVLRRLCGEGPPEWVEQEVAVVLNRLIQYPNLIHRPQTQQPCHTHITQAELDTALEQQPIDEDCAKALILKLAAERYDSLGDEEYETVRLRRLFSNAECGTEPDAELLKNSVSKICFARREVSLWLKNGQVIERSDQQ